MNRSFCTNCKLQEESKKLLFPAVCRSDGFWAWESVNIRAKDRIKPRPVCVCPCDLFISLTGQWGPSEQDLAHKCSHSAWWIRE